MGSDINIREVIEDKTLGFCIKKFRISNTHFEHPEKSLDASNLITGVFQVSVVFLGAFLLGFRPLGGTAGIVLAYMLSLMLVLCNVGFGLLTATIAKSSSVASGLAFVFILPQMMLGSFIPGIPEHLSKLVPSFYVTQTLTNVFIRGESATSALSISNFGVLLVYSVAVIMLGIILHNRNWS